MDTPDEADARPGAAGALFRRRRRKIMAVIWSGMALFVGGAIVPSALGAGVWWPAWLWSVGLVGFAAAWLTMMGVGLTGIAFRCPACRANLPQLFLYGSGYATGGGVRFCPRCGCDFNATEADVVPPTAGPTSD